MLLSTAIPIVIAAIVIVIISKGILIKPIIPKMKKAAIKFGTTPIKDKAIFLNNIKNIANMPNITIPRVRIWDLNKLCNKLLNKISTPANLYSSLSNFNLVLSSLSNDLITTGPFVEKFENNLKKYLKCKFSYVCSSGTAAIHLAMLSLNLKKNDIILMPAINVIA